MGADEVAASTAIFAKLALSALACRRIGTSGEAFGLHWLVTCIVAEPRWVTAWAWIIPYHSSSPFRIKETHRVVGSGASGFLLYFLPFDARLCLLLHITCFLKRRPIEPDCRSDDPYLIDCNRRPLSDDWTSHGPTFLHTHPETHNSISKADLRPVTLENEQGDIQCSQAHTSERPAMSKLMTFEG